MNYVALPPVPAQIGAVAPRKKNLVFHVFISLSTVFICRSSWILWFFMYQGAFRMDRRVLDWNRWRISMLDYIWKGLFGFGNVISCPVCVVYTICLVIFCSTCASFPIFLFHRTGWSGGNTLYLYSRGSGFESRAGHRLSLLLLLGGFLCPFTKLSRWYIY
jgi:hypothetical protein